MRYDTEFIVLVDEKRYEPKHARCYCVATAAGVATVVAGVSTAASAGYSAYQSNKAADAMKGGNPDDLYGSKIKPQDYESNVDVPSFDPMRGAADYLAMLPELRQISGEVTRGGVNAREKAMPGSKQIMSEGAANLIAMGRGQVRQDVVDNTNRIVAERTGGGIDPSAPDSYAGGNSAATDEFARNIGRTSQANVNDFLSAAPAWEGLADKFAYTPEEAYGGAMDMLKSRFASELGAADLQLKVDQDMYGAGLNINRTIAAPDPGAVGARNDELLRTAIQNISGGKGNYLTTVNGVSGGLQGILSGYSKVKAGMGTTGTNMGTGTGGANLPVGA